MSGDRADVLEAVRNLAVENVAVSIAVGLLASEMIYRTLVRSHVRRALGL